MKKKRVLLVCGGLSTEGIGVFLLNTIENINTNEFELTFALATKYPQTYEERIINAGGRIVRTYEIGEGIKGKIKHFLNLIQLIKKEGPFDLVHSHMDFFNGINLLAAYIGGVNKRISHSHIGMKPKLTVAERTYYTSMKILITIFSTQRLGCSKVANANLNGDGQTLFNGIDLQSFSAPKKFPADITMDKSKKNIMTVGRLHHQKNPFFLLKVIKELSLVKDDFHFYWVGSGSLEKEIITLTFDLNINSKITFLKNRLDVDQLMYHMDLFIFPSLYEGLGIVLVEAQASALPCIVSTAVTEEVNLGLCKFLDLDIGEKLWAEEIKAFLENKDTCNLQLDHKKLKEFDIKYMVKQLEKIYT